MMGILKPYAEKVKDKPSVPSTIRNNKKKNFVILEEYKRGIRIRSKLIVIPNPKQRNILGIKYSTI
jgi:hypothetical protein